MVYRQSLRFPEVVFYFCSFGLYDFLDINKVFYHLSFIFIYQQINYQNVYEVTNMTVECTNCKQSETFLCLRPS